MALKSLTRSLYGLVLFLALPAIAQNTSTKPTDPEMVRVQAMVTQAKKEAEEFSKSGGKADRFPCSQSFWRSIKTRKWS